MDHRKASHPEVDVIPKYQTRSIKSRVLVLIILAISMSSVTFLLVTFGEFHYQVYCPSHGNSLIPGCRTKKVLLSRRPPRGPPPGNKFVYSNIVDEPIDTVWNATFSEIMSGYGDGTCTLSDGFQKKSRHMSQIFQHWKHLTQLEQIPWFLAYGTLLGYTRDKSITPYDRDTDIFLPSWAYDRLLKYVTPLPLDMRGVPEEPILHLQPEFKTTPPTLRRMYNCDGTNYRSFCTIAVNMGRLGIHGDHLDLWHFDHDHKHDIVFFTNHVVNVVYNVNYFLPLRRCTFHGVESLCPNDPLAFVRWRYGPETSKLLPYELCSKGKWVSRKQDPKLHEEWETQWAANVGKDIANEVFNKSEFKWFHNKQFCRKYPQDRSHSGICNFPSDENDR